MFDWILVMDSIDVVGIENEESSNISFHGLLELRLVCRCVFTWERKSRFVEIGDGGSMVP